MVLRRGIGASAVAAVIFSVILVSNAALYSAAQDRAGLYGVAAAEDSVGAAQTVLSAAAASDALATVQGWLSAGPLRCAAAAQAISNEVAGVRVSEDSGGVSVSATAAVWTGSASADNLTSVAPFEGAERGVLDLAITISASGGSPDGVSYSKVETHLVHLPARPSQEAADCQGAAALLASSIEGTPVANCTAGVVSPLVDRLGAALASAASKDGFRLALAYSFGPTSACTVWFRMLVTQPGVQGPAGQFSVAMEENGSAAFAPQA